MAEYGVQFSNQDIDFELGKMDRILILHYYHHLTAFKQMQWIWATLFSTEMNYIVLFFISKWFESNNLEGKVNFFSTSYTVNLFAII